MSDSHVAARSKRPVAGPWSGLVMASFDGFGPDEGRRSQKVGGRQPLRYLVMSSTMSSTSSRSGL